MKRAQSPVVRKIERVFVLLCIIAIVILFARFSYLLINFVQHVGDVPASLRKKELW